MSKLSVLNTKGEKVKDITLSKEIWGIEPNDAVLYDAITLSRNSLRQGTADTKHAQKLVEEEKTLETKRYRTCSSR